MEFIILEKLWQRTLNPNSNKAHDENCSWNKEIEILYRMGIGMEDTLRYLYFEKPSLVLFKEWILENKKTISINEPDLDENVLSEEDLMFWKENGYVVVKNAISRSECEATQEAIWEFLGINPDKEESWYQSNAEQRGLMLTFSDHPTLNKNRQSKRIQKAYEQLYGTTQIYKTIDKVSFNPPENDNFQFLGSTLHWDVSLHLPIPFAFQGLLYLTDCGIDDGAFHCVAGFHHKIEDWIHDLSPNENAREVALKTLKSIPVVGNAGDFIIWHQALPHCATPNRNKTPRMVQYLTYLPDNYKVSSVWI
ncbi:phytanoyl-CoA dioxygenase family protein [Flavobacterium sp. ZT3R18]|uniref:phytanoyl-CoA dioxygenase family protein n=1 Tax=Flavobacterium sp. ZT3R18 TaxID=2594429 RepID=UPI00117AC39D|nr:phytanoyl-CoA dioxygenase family protein [Flavobacterium sp. ZT3R18]TRX35698.1 phytanoyl-CoA dioxygenase family protein [Flavobacterium sp. ZT3R18]